MSNCEKKQNYSETIVFALIIMTSCIISLISGDNLISAFAAICGLTYTILAGKGKFYCYIIGMCGTLCYAYTAFNNTLYGNFALYAFYYFPMEIAGIINWHRHLNKEKSSVIKKKIGKNKNIKYIALTIFVSLLTGFIMKHTGNQSPFADAFATVFSIYGMWLTVKRCIEQWDIWLFVNVLSLLMWIKAYLNGSGALAIVYMWLIYCILAIYFRCQWEKELTFKTTV